ncbi:uncharacterized protein PSANT_05695 [Moesziomyces antarcticus]|nr:uncharacterized protein PSANT_05695 [Moesziomyces antarcticus]
MSSDAAAPVPQSVAAPAAAPQESDSTASPFGATMLPRKDQESASADIHPPHHQISEADAAAVADAAAAAAAADASSAAQTITQLATAATEAASADAAAAAAAASAGAAAPNGTTDQPAPDATAAAPAAAPDNTDAAAPAAATAEQSNEAAAQPADDPTAPPAAAPAADAHEGDAKPTVEEPQETASGLPRNVESELRDIYSVSSAIANFCVAHVNQVNVPTPQKVRTVIQKALKLTSSLSMLLAQPEVALRQLDADDNKRPAESKLDSARKRQRSSDWDGNRSAGSPSTPGLPMAPFTPNSGLRVFPDGSLPTSFPSPGFDDVKGPQYKKRSRAPAPGSCQACGTSETPEWRRGPDGARTLCNACGLHYAKLVRKRMQQEGGEEASPSQPPPQLALVSLEELRASTKSAEAAAAAGLTPSASSASLNGTPLKGERSAWNTPSKPPRVPSALANSVIAPDLEADAQQTEAVSASLPPPPAPAPVSAPASGVVEPAPTPVSAPAPVDTSVIAPELAAEGGDERPMDTDQ